MPRYQIILESEEQLTDQEFQEWVEIYFAANQAFKLIYAQNLEGIRKELWEKRNETGEINNPSIQVNYEDVVDLFKLGE